MSGAAPNPRQGPVASWLAQMIGTLVLATVVFFFVKSAGAPFSGAGYEFQRQMMAAILLVALPAIVYLRTFKRRLNADEAAVKRNKGVPSAPERQALMKSLAVGGALCELPMALGVLHLFFGGDTRWFVYATLITIAVRLSYRPYTRS